MSNRFFKLLRGVRGRPRGGQWNRLAVLGLALLLGLRELGCAEEIVGPQASSVPGLTYTNRLIHGVPWSIHVVRLERTNSLYEIHTMHAGGKAIGLDTLSGQVAGFDGRFGTVVAAINGDFYHRDGAYAGAPLGLQVAEGELLSAPSGAASVWIDAQGQPHLGRISSAFQVVWPDGSAARFGLNGERRSEGLELYTQAVGRSTRTAGGREIILETGGSGSWLPLRVGEVYSARVREIRQAGNTRIEPGTMVLSAGPAIAQRLPSLSISNVLRLSTATVPALHGVQAAISGDPILVSNGLAQKGSTARAMGYHQHSMEQRHPRAAVGWNQQYFFLVEVDGRQWDLSVGMSLDELSDYLVRLGCEQAMNFDGGGSATLWFAGEVRNSPCERAEREISNCLAIIKRESRSAR